MSAADPEAVLAFQRARAAQAEIGRPMTPFDAFLAGWRAHAEHVGEPERRPVKLSSVPAGLAEPRNPLIRREMARAARRAAGYVQSHYSTNDAIDAVRPSFPYLTESHWEQIRKLLDHQKASATP